MGFIPLADGYHVIVPGSLQMRVVNKDVLKVENGSPMKSGCASLQVGVEDARPNLLP
jgi:hypothetical protein